MFGFLKKSKLVESTAVVFDLKPLYESLSSSQKKHFEELASFLHTDIHQIATVSGFSELLRCAVGKKKLSGPEFISPLATQAYIFDKELTVDQFQSFYPISKFDSVQALKDLISEFPPQDATQYASQNELLSAISGEAAVRLLRGDFATK